MSEGPEVVSDATPRRQSAIDMRDQNGLRGVLSIWIVVFHCLVFDHNPIDLQGSSLMPLFFLLSGFSLTVGYYKKFINASLPQTYPLPSSNTKAQESVTLWKFMYLRLVRVLPVYYICNALCYPAFFQGFGAFDPKNTSQLTVTTITTFIPVSTWLGGFLGMPFDGPSWTVCTLIGMWFFFPTLLRCFYNQSDHSLLEWIRRLYWIQAFILIIVFVIILIVTGGEFWPAFIFGTMHPLSRLPVFAMGVAAGILTLRHPPSEESQQVSTFDKALLEKKEKKGEDKVVHTAVDEENSLLAVPAVAVSPSAPSGNYDHVPTGLIPWFNDGSWYMPISWLFCGCLLSKRDDVQSVTLENTSYQLLTSSTSSKLLNKQILNLFCITTFTVIIDIIVRYVGNVEGVFGAIWLQALNPYAQLSLIVAMTRTGTSTEASWVTSILRHPLLQWLGDLSMSVYLVHWVLGFYLSWAVYGRGSILWPAQACEQYKDLADDDAYLNCAEPIYEHIMTYEDWFFVVITPLAIICAAVLFYVVEKPVAKYFRG